MFCQQLSWVNMVEMHFCHLLLRWVASNLNILDSSSSSDLFCVLSKWIFLCGTLTRKRAHPSPYPWAQRNLDLESLWNKEMIKQRPVLPNICCLLTQVIKFSVLVVLQHWFKKLSIGMWSDSCLSRDFFIYVYISHISFLTLFHCLFGGFFTNMHDFHNNQYFCHCIIFLWFCSGVCLAMRKRCAIFYNPREEVSEIWSWFLLSSTACGWHFHHTTDANCVWQILICIR